MAKRRKHKKSVYSKGEQKSIRAGWGNKILAFIALIFALSILVYFPSFKNGFIYDDKFMILMNPLVKGERPFREIFTTEFYSSSLGKSTYYRPLVNLSYWLDYKLFKEKPAGYHITNIILHSIASVLVFLTIWAWSMNFWLASISGAIFSVHPAHTQSVCWISGRTDIISTIFILTSFCLYLFSKSNKKLKFIPLSLTSFLLALFSKEVSVLLPILIVLSDLIKQKKFSSLFEPQKIKIYAGFFLIIAIYFLTRIKVLGTGFGYQSQAFYEWYYQGKTDPSRIITVFKVIFYYLETTLYPTSLSFESKLLVSNSFLDPYFVLSFFSVMSTLAIGLASIKNTPELGFGILWFYITLLPVANILPYRELTMEHLLYVPSVGYCIVIAFLVNITNKRKIAGSLVITILFFMSVLTLSRQPVWKNELTFWKDSVIKAPLKRRPWYNYGIRLYEKQDRHGAIRAYKFALKAEPSNPEVHNNLGALYFEQGEIELAIKEFEEAIRLDPNHAKAKINLENVLRLKNLIHMKQMPNE